MPSNTTYKPLCISDFEASKLNFNAQGVSVTATAGVVTNLDYTLLDDCLITGCWLLISGATIGDKIAFQVVDGSGAFSGTPGTVLNQFVSNWYLSTCVDTQFDMDYPAKIYTGLTLRLVFTSTGSTNVSIAANYKLHKVLV